MNKEGKTWQDKRIGAMNRKIKRSGNKRAMAENYIEEHFAVCNSQAKSKREYKQQTWALIRSDHPTLSAQSYGSGVKQDNQRKELG